MKIHPPKLNIEKGKSQKNSSRKYILCSLGVFVMPSKVTNDDQDDPGIGCRKLKRNSEPRDLLSKFKERKRSKFFKAKENFKENLVWKVERSWENLANYAAIPSHEFSFLKCSKNVIGIFFEYCTGQTCSLLGLKNGCFDGT